MEVNIIGQRVLFYELYSVTSVKWLTHASPPCFSLRFFLYAFFPFVSLSELEVLVKEGF
jgi:hypothetical protein